MATTVVTEAQTYDRRFRRGELYVLGVKSTIQPRKPYILTYYVNGGFAGAKFFETQEEADAEFDFLEQEA